MERFIYRDLHRDMICNSSELETTLIFNGWLSRTAAHSSEEIHTIKNDTAEEYLMGNV